MKRGLVLAIVVANLGPALWCTDAAGQGGGGVEIRAQLTPRQFTVLSSETASRIDRITTRVGTSFNKGDVLVEFDCAVQRAQLARAEAVVVQAEKTLAINRRLVQLKSIGQLELEISLAEVNKAKAERSIVQTAVSKCTIVAPFSGITVDQKAREFQYTTPGQPVLDVVDNRSLEVEMIVPSRWLAWLKLGTSFEVRIDETGKVYPVRVARISGRVDPVSQSIKMIGEITEDAPELMAGMSGAVKISPPQ